MTEEEWDRYREIVASRIARRAYIREQAGFSSEPGGAEFHRSHWRRTYPQFGGRVDPHQSKQAPDRHR